VRAAELSVARGTVTLERFGQVALPPGAVRDGEVADPDSVAEAIKRLWSSGKFSTKRVTLGVANQRVIVRQVDLPWMPLDELRRSLGMLVQDVLPIPVEQAILDFHPVEEFVSDSGARTLRVLLVAAAREMVLSSLNAVEKAGLTLTQVDLTPFAVLRALVDVDHLSLGEQQTEALVDVGARVTNIIVHQNGVPRFVRILMMGGEHLTEAVAERLGVPLEQAETVKQQLGMSPVAGALPSEHPGARVLESAASALVEEIRGSLDYYLAQPAAVPLGRLRVSGGGARLTNFSDRLAAGCRLPVDRAGTFSRLQVGKTGLTPEQLSYVEPVAAVPVGLAMGVAS